MNQGAAFINKKIFCPEGRLPPLLRAMIRGKEINLLVNNTYAVSGTCIAI